MKTISIQTSRRSQMVDITAKIEKAILEAGREDGICLVYVPHTTAGITINENADPSVQSDIQAVLSKLIPEGAGYSHREGNADSHIKAGLMGSSVSVIVEGGKLRLGTWQGIFFCEFDGPRSRKTWIDLLSRK